MTISKYANRIIYLDYLRVLAILGVLLNHISDNWKHSAVMNWDIALIYNSFGRIGVPVFLMLTGVLLLNNKLPIKDFIKRRYPRVIIPFLFWMTLLIGYFIVLNPNLINNNLIYYIIERYLSDRWYVWMILGVYLIIPIFAAFIKSSKLEGVKYFLIIWLFTTSLFTLSVIFNFSMHYLDLVVFSGPIGFLMLGYYLHNNEFSWNPKKIVLLSFVIFIIITFVKFLIMAQHHFDPYLFRYYIFTKKSRLEIDPFSVIQVCALVLVVKYIPNVSSGFLNKVSTFANKKVVLALIISISQASYGIYLNHYFITKTLKDFSFPFNDLPSLIFVPILTVSVLLISYCVIILLNRVPVINKLTGFH